MTTNPNSKQPLPKPPVEPPHIPPPASENEPLWEMVQRYAKPYAPMLLNMSIIGVIFMIYSQMMENKSDDDAIGRGA